MVQEVGMLTVTPRSVGDSVVIHVYAIAPEPGSDPHSVDAKLILGGNLHHAIVLELGQYSPEGRDRKVRIITSTGVVGWTWMGKLR